MRIACLAVDATAVTGSRDEQEAIIPINSERPFINAKRGYLVLILR